MNDGAWNFNSVIHFTYLESQEATKNKTESISSNEAWSFSPGIVSPWLQSQPQSENLWSSFSFLELSFDRFQKTPESSSLERRQNVYHLCKTAYQNNYKAISCYWRQTKVELSSTMKGPPISLKMTETAATYRRRQAWSYKEIWYLTNDFTCLITLKWTSHVNGNTGHSGCS